ncbi:hypothetical protein CFAM422_009082 [Trichoderma lentiforme]|uniref:Uncharacterized protein n=1 Tax=Trichoderma lentiforme TaxID=1567552 RepID=A0A9P4XAI3_9HYPO|nr:hypothetical protein CFAM422_009082 [Trichoderma lentiforme]
MERYIEGLSLHHWHRRQKEAVPIKHVAQRHRGAKESGRRSGRDREARKGGRVDVLQRRDEGSSQQPGWWWRDGVSKLCLPSPYFFVPTPQQPRQFGSPRTRFAV